MGIKLKTIFICIGIFFVLPLYGEDWYAWRGPDRNGISPESNLNYRSVQNNPKINWEKELGYGYSIVAVRGNYLYTMGYEGRKNVVFCLDVKTGREVWKYAYPCSMGQYKGPKATPVIDGSNVYTFSQDGHLICQNAGTGRIIWQHHIADDFGVRAPGWGFASSALILGDTLYINAGRNGMAFDKTTGKKVWFSGTDIGNYSTPLKFRFNNKTYLGIFGEDKLYAVDPVNGKILWSFDWRTSHDVNAADPLFIGNRVFVSSGYRRGCSLWDFSSGTPRKVWENKSLSSHFTSPILIGNHIYGINGNAGYGDLTCLEVSTGKVKWSENTGFGSLIATKDDHLIVINERGTLIIAKADPNSYKEIARKDRLLNRLCWTSPVLSNGNLYLRNDKGTLISIDLK
jgi:outer membrane protein assembly factor BamB